jgi:hypothetical protein
VVCRIYRQRIRSTSGVPEPFCKLQCQYRFATVELLQSYSVSWPGWSEVVVVLQFAHYCLIVVLLIFVLIISDTSQLWAVFACAAASAAPSTVSLHLALLFSARAPYDASAVELLVVLLLQSSSANAVMGVQPHASCMRAACRGRVHLLAFLLEWCCFTVMVVFIM